MKDDFQEQRKTLIRNDVLFSLQHYGDGCWFVNDVASVPSLGWSELFILLEKVKVIKPHKIYYGNPFQTGYLYPRVFML